MPDKLFKIQEAASFLNLSIRTLQRYDQKGLLVPLRTPGGQRRYLIDKLEEFKKSRSSNPSDLPAVVFGYPKALRVKRPKRLSKTHLKKAKKLKDSLFENSSNLVTVQTAAYILGVSAMTLRRWDKAKILVPLRTIGGQRRYLRQQVEALQKPSQTWQKQNLGESAAGFQNQFHLGLAQAKIDLGEPIKIDRSKQKPERLSKSQKIILFGSLFVFLFLSVVTIVTKTQETKISEALGWLKTFGENVKVKSPVSGEIGKGFALYDSKGVVLGEHTDGSNLLFNINVPSAFKGIATFSAGLATENQDINAGTGTLTASNVVY